MKIIMSKSVKKVLSLMLAIVMLLGTLFTANIGVNINADATTNTIAYWDGSTKTAPTANSDGVYIIDSAEKLAWVALTSSNTSGNTYKVEGVDIFVMQPQEYAQELMGLASSTEVKTFFESKTNLYSWNPGNEFQGIFDGNGSAVYGLYNKEVIMFGLFPCVNAATIKNVAIMNCYHYYSGSDTDFAGLVFGRGKWGNTDVVTVDSCVVANGYIYSNGAVGVVSGHCAGSTLAVNNCLFYGNTKDLSVGWNKYYFPISGSADTTTLNGELANSVTNTITIGSPVRNVFSSYYNNVFTDQTMYNADATNSSHGTVVNMNQGLSAQSMCGIAAKQTMSTLNWATNSANGEGYWHLMYGDYPLPFKPDGWQEIEIAPVWDGTKADSFAGGSGTESDPYIIETAEQLYKMVQDGGRIWNDGDIVSYKPAYYKVADGVTDLYLNNVQGGDLDTIKGLVSAGNAKNWTQNFNANTYQITDADADGLVDEMKSFVGVFDGNGVTIHGLYSTTNDSTYTAAGWSSCSGIGFVPALVGNSIIKNVHFDKSYIYSQKVWAAVLTTSFGLDNNGTDTVTIDGVSHTKLKSKYFDTASVGIYNVSVRNSHIESTAAVTANYLASCGGLVSTHSSPTKAMFVNCLFDGYGSELVIPESSTYDFRGGIFSASISGFGYSLTNCVSLGYYPMPNDDAFTGTDVFKYMHNIAFHNVYTDVANISDNTFTAGEPTVVAQTDTYTKDIMPKLNWMHWSLVGVEDGRTIPMSTGVTQFSLTGIVNYKDLVLTNLNGSGNLNLLGVVPSGEYGHYHKLIGSGTEDDPYLISNAKQLATAISTGGIHVTQKLYYKLTNDIDLMGLEWIDTDTVTVSGTSSSGEAYEATIYKYVDFVGTLDGNGYTIYGLNAENAGALIPTLDGGTVKNLNLRSAVASEALIAAESKNNVTIDNCSAEDCTVSAGDWFVGSSSGTVTITNSYYDDTYYLADGTVGTPTLDGTTWYGIVGGTPRLVCNAKSKGYADVDADGVAQEYSPLDLITLRKHLLRDEDYKYIYGDVSGNGKTNSSDLVILARSIINDYNHCQDGFWRNVELGNFKIYYGENDNYDAARKLELYLEASVPGVDVIKAVSADNTVSGENANKNAVYVHSNDIEEAPDGTLEIIVGNIANYSDYTANTVATGANTYAITYDNEKGVLWLQGENFTAVEQAVLDFIAGSDVATGKICTKGSTTLDDDKLPVTVNGTTYYYTWADEFNGESLSEDIWSYSGFQTESSAKEEKYTNLECAFNEDFSKLYTINEGKLTINRGVYGGTTDTANLGYVDLGEQKTGTNGATNTVESDDNMVSSGDISAERALLVKRGYFEFKASLPSDGHSFASWWMLGTATGGNNNGYSDSLYGKVYKFNPYYDGTSNSLDSSKPSTYKYQLPNSNFELDIIELMQDITNFDDQRWYNTTTRKTYNFRTGYTTDTSGNYANIGLTGVYDYALPFNIHKFFNTGLDSNGQYHIIDWSTGTASSTGYTANSSSSDTADGIFSSLNEIYDFGNTTATFKKGSSLGATTTVDTMQYSADAHDKLTAERKYGFEWKVTTNDAGVGQSFSFTVYIYNADNNGTTKSLTINDISYNENTALERLLNDAEIANQYLYFLIDNICYTSNQYYQNGTTLFADLLTYDNTDKTTMDIDYLRVYQENDKRDIVTPETEDFNNGNHFGY